MKIRKRVMICLCILSVLASLFLLSGVMEKNPHIPAYTVYSRGVTTAGTVYYYENWHGTGYLYLMGENGTVHKVVASDNVNCDRIDAVGCADSRVFALYSLYPGRKESQGSILLSNLLGRSGVHYRSSEANKRETRICLIAVYDPQMNLVGVTDWFSLQEGEKGTGISASDDTYQVTAIDADGKTVNVYAVNGADLKKPSDPPVQDDNGDKKNEGPKVPEVTMYRDNPAGAFFVDALYRDGALNVLTDKDEPYGPFIADQNIKTAVRDIAFTLPQTLYFYRGDVAVWAGTLIVWLALLLLTFRLLVDKNRMMYIFVATEAGYLTVLICWLIFSRWSFLYSREIDFREYGQMALLGELEFLGDLSRFNYTDSDYYNSEEYRKLLNELNNFQACGSNEDVFEDIFILRLSDGMIMVSAEGRNREYASFAYGQELIGLREKLNGREPEAFCDIYPDGVQMNALGIRAAVSQKTYALCGICFNGLSTVEYWSSYYRLILLVLVLFVMGSVIIAIIMHLQSLDLLQFMDAIEDVALGRTMVRVPQVPAKDVQTMWSSLAELAKRMEETNHEKYRIFEAYYRFAPKNIETIMDKDTIFEVTNGDIVNKEGTLLLFSIEEADSEEKRIKSLVNIVTYMAEFTNDKDGILVSYDEGLTALEFLFLDERTPIMDKTNHFLHRNAFDDDADFVSAFLYHDEFTYGVVGINAQSLPFLTTRYTKQMKGYAAWFESLKVPMVVTEDILQREDIGESRYIGFIALQENRINLYEILDACAAKERQQKIVNREKFEKTLDLFYKGDYYTARNRFSEILKDCPEDLISRWYIFESERYLSGETDPVAMGRLRAGD